MPSEATRKNLVSGRNGVRTIVNGENDLVVAAGLLSIVERLPASIAVRCSLSYPFEQNSNLRLDVSTYLPIYFATSLVKTRIAYPCAIYVSTSLGDFNVFSSLIFHQAPYGAVHEKRAILLSNDVRSWLKSFETPNWNVNICKFSEVEDPANQ